MRGLKGENKSLYLIICVLIVVTIQIYFIDFLKIKKITPNINKFREMNITDYMLATFLENDFAIENLTINMLIHNFSLIEEKKMITIKNSACEKRIKEHIYEKYYSYYNAIFKDIEYFPVPEDISGGETISYVNSWFYERTYGGNRVHEGTDIMTSNNIPGYFPIVSITDGTVEKIGWLEKGGYRIGIRSPNDGYFYYAHLNRYASGLKVGDKVTAGTLIAYMGNSGYGKKEGTVGKFDVHLHLGIYVNGEEGELSINPYWILKYLEKKRTIF